jgi:hypothetical protein
VGDFPIAQVTGDFNGDGRPDLATANGFSGDVTVLLGVGDGAFRDAGRFAVGGRPSALLAGDFNGDGRPDLATANTNYSFSDSGLSSSSGDVTVLLGVGDGTFRESGRFAVGRGPSALLTGDFNGDGRPDLATANGFSGDVTVLLGVGDGTFRDAGRFAVGRGPSALLTGDFNGDGRPDLATANTNYSFSDSGLSSSSGDVTVLLGVGDGTFRDAGRFAVGGGPRPCWPGTSTATVAPTWPPPIRTIPSPIVACRPPPVT